MKAVVRAAAFVAWLVALPATHAPGFVHAQGATFHAGTAVVSVYATVKNRDGHLVPNLPQSAFHVFDNGRPVEISIFSNSPQPITAALMLDMSGSMTAEFYNVRAAALALVGVLADDDRIRIGTFNDEVALSPYLTGDKAILTRVINEELWPVGGTPLWQAIQAGMNSLPPALSRPVVLVVTDGKVDLHDRVMAALYARVEQQARDRGVMIYAIGFNGSGLDSGVEKLADRTGGGHFEVAKGADLTAIFRQLINELRQQYLLGFVPGPSDGKTHELQVKLSDRSLRVQARKEYAPGARQ